MYRSMLLALFCASAVSQEVVAQARWINDSRAATADASRTPISLQFRREVTLATKPKAFRVRVSADNRCAEGRCSRGDDHLARGSDGRLHGRATRAP